MYCKRGELKLQLSALYLTENFDSLISSINILFHSFTKLFYLQIFNTMYFNINSIY